MTDDRERAFKIPVTMNAVRLHGVMGPAGLVYEEIETPQPSTADCVGRHFRSTYACFANLAQVHKH